MVFPIYTLIFNSSFVCSIIHVIGVFSVVLLIMLLKAALSFESVDEILKCGRLNES